VEINVRANKAPAVKITNRINNVVYNAPATINLAAAAIDADGTIAGVKFYRSNTLVGVDSTSPYICTIAHVAPGNYSLVAKTFDNKGLTGLSESIAIQVAATINKAPTVSITSPANNAVFTAPANITINALASDADGTVASVKFYNPQPI